MNLKRAVMPVAAALVAVAAAAGTAGAAPQTSVHPDATCELLR